MLHFISLYEVMKYFYFTLYVAIKIGLYHLNLTVESDVQSLGIL